MVNPLEIMDSRREKAKIDSRSGRTRDQIKFCVCVCVCVDENGFLCHGQIIWLDLHRERLSSLSIYY